MLGNLIGAGIVAAHFISYKEFYWKIFSTFSAAYITKRLVRMAGDKDKSDLVGLGGYALTFAEVVKLLSAVKNGGMKIADDQTKQQVIGGLLGKGVDWLMELTNK
jgi:hypothetical protein